MLVDSQSVGKVSVLIGRVGMHKKNNAYLNARNSNDYSTDKGLISKIKKKKQHCIRFKSHMSTTFATEGIDF